MKNSESGFTLVETLIAIVVLVFGIIAVTNLLVVAASSNSLANESTAAAAEASEMMDRIKAVPFQQLVGIVPPTFVGGDLLNDAGATPNCDGNAVDCLVGAGGPNWNQTRLIPGVGRIRTRWQIQLVTTPPPPPQPANSVVFITVRSEGLGRLTRVRSRAEFTAFRSCTTGPLPLGNCP
jgi:type II secretory pathway pseudopilin PulG